MNLLPVDLTIISLKRHSLSESKHGFRDVNSIDWFLPRYIVIQVFTPILDIESFINKNGGIT